MRIGVDVRELTKNKAGKGWYVFHVLKEISKIDKENEYILYGDADSKVDLWSKAKFIDAGSTGLSWHWKVKNRLKKDGVDLYWAPTSPIVPSITNIPFVYTIHDLTTFLFPKTHELKGRIIEKLFIGKALKKASKIIANSEATKKDTIKLFPFSKNKIEITYLGADESFKPSSDKEKNKIREKYGLPTRYVLFVGTLEPRKNISKLIEAFALLPSEMQKGHPLVIVGKKGWLFEEIFKKVMELNLQDEVKFLDYVEFEDLPAIYSNASVFVYPSLYEGFGLPVLEAMSCGAPVMTSNISSLPEVAGDAGILINPEDANEIAKNIEAILTDIKLRDELSKKSLNQAKKFSWQKTACETLRILSD